MAAHRLVRSFACLSIALAASAAGPTTVPAVRSPTDIGVWADRVRAVVPPKGWNVSTNGDSITIRRDVEVGFVNYINRDGSDITQADGHTTYRLKLTFGAPVSLDEYARLFAENEATRLQTDVLSRDLRDLPQAIPSNAHPEGRVAKTPEQARRLEDFRVAVAKLPYHPLPELFAPDHSVQFDDAFPVGTGIFDKRAEPECEAVRQGVLRLFGTYDVDAVKQEVDRLVPRKR